MGDFVLTSLRSPSLAGAVGRQIQGLGSHGPDRVFTTFFSLFRLGNGIIGEPIGPADEFYEEEKSLTIFSIMQKRRGGGRSKRNVALDRIVRFLLRGGKG